MAARFDYPTEGWSTGTMRKSKRGPTQLAMDMQRRGEPQSALVEMEKAAGFGLAARGGTAPLVGGVDVSGTARSALPDMIAAHKDQLEQAVNAHAMGNMTPSSLKKLFTSLGWQLDMSGTSIQATDPNGELHKFGAEAQAR